MSTQQNILLKLVYKLYIQLIRVGLDVNVNKDSLNSVIMHGHVVV